MAETIGNHAENSERNEFVGCKGQDSGLEFAEEIETALRMIRDSISESQVSDDLPDPRPSADRNHRHPSFLGFSPSVRPSEADERMAFFTDNDELFQLNGYLRRDVVSEPTFRVLEKAIHHARNTRWESVRTPHLFMGLMAAPDHAVLDWGNRLGANLGRLLDQFKEIFQAEEPDDFISLVRMNREFLSDNVIRLLYESLARARTLERFRISPMDLLVELFTARSSIVAECFRRIGLSAEQLTELAILAERESERE